MKFSFLFAITFCNAVLAEVGFNQVSEGAIKLTFEKKSIIKKRDSASLTVPIGYSPKFLLTTSLLFSNGDEVDVTIDTTSLDFWVISKEVYESLSELCFPDSDDSDGDEKKRSSDWDQFCSDISYRHYFDPLNSTTFQNNTKAKPFHASYSDGTFPDGRNNILHYASIPSYDISGYWGYDNIQISPLAMLRNFSFPVVNSTSGSNNGVLGLGFPNSDTKKSTDYPYDNFIMKMKDQGIINKAAYSLYMIDVDGDRYGEILFGGIDHAKYQGSLATIPVHIEANSKLPPHVFMDKLLLDNGSNSITNVSYATVFNVAYKYSVFPEDIYQKFTEQLGAKWLDDDEAILFPCPEKDLNLILDFSGHKILSKDFYTRSDYDDSSCVANIVLHSNNYFVIGENILQNMYVVYDLEDSEISIAETKFVFDIDVQPFGSNGSSAALKDGSSSSTLSNSSLSASSNGQNSSSKKNSANMFTYLPFLLAIMLGIAMV